MGNNNGNLSQIKEQNLYFEQALKDKETNNIAEPKATYTLPSWEEIAKPTKEDLEESLKWINEKVWPNTPEEWQEVYKWWENLQNIYIKFQDKYKDAWEILQTARTEWQLLKEKMWDEWASNRVAIISEIFWFPKTQENLNKFQEMFNKIKTALDIWIKPESLKKNLEYIGQIKDPVTKQMTLQYAWGRMSESYIIQLENWKVKISERNEWVKQENVAWFNRAWNSALESWKISLQDIQQALIISTTKLKDYFDSSVEDAPTDAEWYYNFLIESYSIKWKSLNQIKNNPKIPESDKIFLEDYMEEEYWNVNFSLVKQNYLATLEENMKLFNHPQIKKLMEGAWWEWTPEEQAQWITSNPLGFFAGKPWTLLIAWLWTLYVFWMDEEWKGNIFTWLKRLFLWILALFWACIIAKENEGATDGNLCEKAKNYLFWEVQNAFSWWQHKTTSDSQNPENEPGDPTETESPEQEKITLTKEQEEASKRVKNTILTNSILKEKYDDNTLTKRKKTNAKLDDYLLFINKNMQGISIEKLIGEWWSILNFDILLHNDIKALLPTNFDILFFKEILSFYLWGKSFEQIDNIDELKEQTQWKTINDIIKWENSSILTTEQFQEKIATYKVVLNWKTYENFEIENLKQQWDKFIATIDLWTTNIEGIQVTIQPFDIQFNNNWDLISRSVTIIWKPNGDMSFILPETTKEINLTQSENTITASLITNA